MANVSLVLFFSVYRVKCFLKPVYSWVILRIVRLDVAGGCLVADLL
jgi:hypothetical protein